MPRLIDHAARDTQIGEAALRVLVRDGLASLSVRKVAEEAGIATASLRRAHPTQDHLRQWCFVFVRSRVAARIAELRGEGRERAVALLAELLPLDDTRREELVAQLQLATLAITQPQLREASADLAEGVRTVCRLSVDELARHGQLRMRAHADPASVEEAVDTLHATLDGIALQALLDPAVYTAEVTLARLERTIAALAAP